MRKIVRNTLGFLLAWQSVCFGFSRDGCPGGGSKVLDFNQLVVVPLQEMLFEVVSFLPDFLVAICILFLGWLVANICNFIISKFLKSVGFDGFAKSIGIAALLEEDKEKPVKPHEWVGKLTFWVAMTISSIMALNRLRLRIASNQLDNFFHFLLTIFTVVVIFILGMFLSFVVSRIIKSVAQNTKIKNPDIWANITRGAVLVFTTILCLVELGLPPQIMLIAVSGVFISVCIVFVMAFGLGGVGWAGKVLDKMLEKKD